MARKLPTYSTDATPAWQSPDFYLAQAVDRREVKEAARRKRRALRHAYDELQLVAREAGL